MTLQGERGISRGHGCTQEHLRISDLQPENKKTSTPSTRGNGLGRATDHEVVVEIQPHGKRRTPETFVVCSATVGLAGAGCLLCFRVKIDGASHSHVTNETCKRQVHYGVLLFPGLASYCNMRFSALLATCRTLRDGRQRRGTPEAGRRRVGTSRTQKAVLSDGSSTLQSTAMYESLPNVCIKM